MSTVLFLCFLGAVIIAAGMILYNRQRVRSTRQAVRGEPAFGNDFNQRRPGVNPSSRFDDVDDLLDDDFIDPVVTPKTANAAAAAKVVEPSIDEAKIKNNAQHAVQFFPNDIIALMVIARPDYPFVGYELLQALLAAGLRFGKMNIFHRFQQLNATGGVLFSLASASEPGTFDLPKMGGFSCTGLTLFMRVSTQKDVMSTFELMLDTAEQLVNDLGGEIWDDRRQPLTAERINEIRALIGEYEQSLETADLF